MLHYDQLPRPFSILDPWKSMHDRRTVTRTVGKSQSGKLTYETFHWLSLRLKSGWRILDASATFVWLHS